MMEISQAVTPFNRKGCERPTISFNDVNQLLRYEPESGKLFWLNRPIEQFNTKRAWKSWNARYSGIEAFRTIGSGGHFRGWIYNKQYLAHRVVWLMQTGDWPKADIDHIDGDPTNNRLSNLRDVSASVNLKNTGMHRNNTSGVTGVSWSSAHKKWVASLMVNGCVKILGRFDDIQAAAEARQKANREYGFTERHGLAA